MCDKPVRTFQAFSKVTAQVEFGTLKMSSEEIRSVMEGIKAETSIKWHETSYCLLITGSLSEIQNANKYLLDTLKKKGHHLEDLNSHSTKPFPNDIEEDSPQAAENNSEHDDPASAIDKLENNPQSVQYETDVKFGTYFSSRYKEQLAEMEQRSNIRIYWDQENFKVILTPMRNCDAETFLIANESFVSLYQEAHKNMTLKHFSLENSSTDERKRKIISTTAKEFSISIQKSLNRKQWEIYGEEEVVSAVLNKIDQVVPVRLESPTQASADDRSKASDDQSGQTHGRERNVYLEKVLPGNVKISVYQGDITEERVDAIVNAANERLQHVGGVALAISSRGGRVIDRESSDIIKSRGPVKVGEAVHTSSGNLHCTYVIHAVGPEWWKEGAKNSKKHLRVACMNSLYEAEEVEVDSIALPAISSGIYGMPKEVCAEVMFDAVEEYSTQLVPQQGFAVTDVRFVNIDDATVKVFREEFVKRYGSSQGAHPKSHPSSKEDKGKGSSHLPEEKGVSKRKNGSKHGGGAPPNVGLEPGKNVDSAHQFGRGDGGRKNRGAASIHHSSGAVGFTASPSASHNHSASGNGPSATVSHTPPLYSEVATKGKDNKDRTTVTTPKDRKGSLHVNESLLFVSNHRSLARPQNRY